MLGEDDKSRVVCESEAHEIGLTKDLSVDSYKWCLKLCRSMKSLRVMVDRKETGHHINVNMSMLHHIKASHQHGINTESASYPRRG